MDNVTHLFLGAAIGQAVAYRRLGRSALALGAIGNTLPDLDVLASSLGPLAEWQYHRGITHSLFFGPVIGPILGYGLWRAYRRWRPASPCADPGALGAIIAVLVLTLVAHPLLDLFTVYGTQLLAPLWNARFAIPGVPIIDPHYTLILLAGVAVGLARRAERRAVYAAAVALMLSSAYLFYTWEQNQRAESEARAQLAAAGVRAADLRAYTTIFQPWLRRVVVHEPDGVRIGFVSTWDPAPIAWTCRRRTDDPAIGAAATAPEARILARFAQDQVWATAGRDGQGRVVVRFTDLRYGVPGPTVAGWWGVDVTLDGDGRVLGAVRIAVPRPALSWETVAAVYRAGLGDMAGFYAVSGARMEHGAAGC